MINRSWYKTKTFTIGIIAILIAIFVILFLEKIGNSTPLSDVRVIDGDSFNVQNSKFRLLFIDAPEKNQVYGAESAKYFSELMKNADKFVNYYDLLDKQRPKYMIADNHTYDLYGRKLVYVMAGETSVQEQMVKAGAAWVYDSQCRNNEICTRLKKYQEEARDAKRGLWAFEHPIPPWEFRKNK
jgi:endonuclease YncB( thermonuclease family)